MFKAFWGNAVDYPSEVLPSIALGSSLSRKHLAMVKAFRDNMWTM
jgi:hypothetical protein